MNTLVAKVLAGPCFREDIEFGAPQPGQLEAAVKRHIADLKKCLEAPTSARGVRTDLLETEIHILANDVFQAEAAPRVSVRHPGGRASLAWASAAA